MQPSALPDLAHTRSRPLHWLVTATAMSAVIATAALLQPGPAGATHPRTAPAVPAPEPGDIDYPHDCAGAPLHVAATDTGDLDGDGDPEAVAVVRCDGGSGTPPHGIYVLTHGRGDHTTPRVVATLLAAAEGFTTQEIAIRDGVVTANLLGYSSPDVPRCCPDRDETVTWRWADGTFLRTTTAGTTAG